MQWSEHQQYNNIGETMRSKTDTLRYMQLKMWIPNGQLVLNAGGDNVIGYIRLGLAEPFYVCLSLY